MSSKPAVKRSIVHATFAIERVYNHAPSKVFDAFASREAKMKWFGDPDSVSNKKYSLDFRVGGREHAEGDVPDHGVYTYDVVYQDIVPNNRIVSTYEMTIGGNRISVSVATVEFRPEGKGTRLVLTEQGAFLDGYDKPAAREEGTKQLLEALAKALDKAA